MKRVLSGAVLAACVTAPVTPATTPMVGRLPLTAAIIFASPAHGEKNVQGQVVDELYAADIDGGNLVRLTRSGVGHNHFAVSPDRTMIVANRYVKGDSTGDGQLLSDDFKELWIIDLAHGTERALLPGVDAGFGGVAWSPDSKWVYFAAFVDPAQGQAGGTDIFRMPAAGGKPDALTAGMHELMGEPTPLKFVSDVDVSPDGRTMAMVYVPASMWGANRIKTRIVVARVDGTEADLVSDGGPLPPGRRGRWPTGDFDPAFSPDGAAVVFMRVTDRAMVIPTLSSADLMRQNVDGSGLANLSPTDNRNAHGIPSWGPCGVIHTVWDSAGGGVYPQYRQADGSGVTTLRLGIERASHVQWIPGAAC